jgi:cytochrome c oxidase subunit 3
MSTSTEVLSGHNHEKDLAAENPFHQHHFTTEEQQVDASKIGMWLFLVTEVLLFGGLFVGYGIMQGRYPEAWVAAHHHLQREMGFLNTVVLLFSSFTMVMGVYYASISKRSAMLVCLWLTEALAATFLVVKFFEYSHKFHDGLLPGKFFSYVGGPENQAMFFSFYFLMTGLHGIHILIGMASIGYIIYRGTRGDFSSAYFTPVDVVGLYWHLVDLIWIYLFPLLYLIS